MQKLNIEKMEQEVLSGNVLVEFGAEWCGPCRAIQPLLEELSSEFKVITVDIDQEQPNVMAEYGIRSIPTILAYKDGKVVSRLVGLQSKSSLKKMFE
jgi:thioredoxin 1